jgi:hypothetical protein
MSYADMAAIVAAAGPDTTWRLRLRLCAAKQLAAAGDARQPDWWVSTHLELLATQPGWVEAWTSAVTGGQAEPGVRDDVITDSMILSAVQSMIKQEATDAATRAQAAQDAERAEAERRADAETARIERDLAHEEKREARRLMLGSLARDDPRALAVIADMPAAPQSPVRSASTKKTAK